MHTIYFFDKVTSLNVCLNNTLTIAHKNHDFSELVFTDLESVDRMIDKLNELKDNFN